MCTVSVLRTVSMPMTSIVAFPTLKIPYFALNVSRSPTGKGTAGTGSTGQVDVAPAGATAELELEDPPTVLPVHTVSCALRDPPPASSAATSAVPLRAALMRPRERQAARSSCHGLDRDGRCLRSYRAALDTTSMRRACAPRRA